MTCRKCTKRERYSELHQPKNRKYDDLCSASAKSVTFPIVCMPTLSHLTWLVLQTALPWLGEPVFVLLLLFLHACSCACIHLYVLCLLGIYDVCWVWQILGHVNACLHMHMLTHADKHMIIAAFGSIHYPDCEISWHEICIEISSIHRIQDEK